MSNDLWKEKETECSGSLDFERKSRYKGYNESGKKATMKYLSENCEKLTFTLKKGTKERWREYAEKNGESVTAMITRLIEREICMESAAEQQKQEAEEIAKRLRNSESWELKDIKLLCEMAGLEKELMAAGEYYDAIAIKAAKKLHVNIM